MIQTYDVRLPTPVQVITFTGDLLVYNSSTTATVQISDSPGVNSIPLGPGSRISWDAKRPLYLWILSGTAKVLTLDNGGTIDDPAVLAALIVDAGLGQSVADALVASSLAANIGSAVPVPPSAASIGGAVGGAVPVPPSASAIGAAVPVPPSANSVASAIQTAGVPAIDVPAVLANDAVNTAGYIKSLSVAAYQSLTFRVNANYSATATGSFTLLVSFRDSFGNILSNEAATMQVTFDGQNMLFTVPCIGVTAVITFLQQAPSPGIAYACRIVTVGSYRNAVRALEFGTNRPPTIGTLSENNTRYSFYKISPKSAGTAAIAYLNNRAGRARIDFLSFAVTAAGSLLITSSVDPSLVFYEAAMPVLSGANTTGAVDLILPNESVQIWFSSQLATTSVRCMVTYLD